MGFFRRGTPMDAKHLEKVERELKAMKEALARHDATTSELSERLTRDLAESDTPAQGLDALVARVDELHAKQRELDAPAPGEPAPAEPDPEVRALSARIAKVESKQSDLDTKLTALADRVTSVSTELANQLTELGHDIDALNDASAPGAADEAALGEIRDGQVRLANEQARYQIAFRDDLARLAEQLRRPTS